MQTTKNLLERVKVDKYNLVSMPQISLVPEEADLFIDYIIDQSVMKNFARTVKMEKPTKYIRAMGFGEGKMLYPGHSFDESKYKKQWKQNSITLEAQKVRGCIVVYDDDLEENIEGAAFKDHIMRIVTAKIANELEYANYMADTHSYNSWCGDDIESLWDGWRYIITHSYDSSQPYWNKVTGSAHIKSACICESGAACESGDESTEADFELAGKIAELSTVEPYALEIKYGMMLKNMPAKYSKHKKDFVFLNAPVVTDDYLMALEKRGTALGDKAITDGDITFYHRVPIIDVPLMPIDLGSDTPATPDHYGKVGGGDYTDVVLTVKNNFIIGMQRDIKIESQREAADEATYVYYNMKFALAIENVDEVVFLKCLEHKC